jgi:hypothetical protein
VVILDGARPGPRVFLAGPEDEGDLLAAAVARQIIARVDRAELAGSVVLAPHGFDGEPEIPLFGLEVRSGPPGWVTTPHVEADLRLPRASRLVRALGEGIVVDAEVPLRFVGGERGRLDPAVVARAGDAFHSLLVAARMLPGAPPRVPVRLIVGEILQGRSRIAGVLAPLGAAGSLIAAGRPFMAVTPPEGADLLLTAGPRSVLLAVPASGVVAAGGLAARLGHGTKLVRPRMDLDARVTVGWCEWIALPDLGVARLHAKIDTGARTCALHVLSMKPAGEAHGRPVLEVRLGSSRPPVQVLVLEEIAVRDSGGHVQKRPVIETTLVLGTVERRVRVTLTDRGDMQFPMLIGRSALHGHVIVDATARHRHRSR